ncbi:MAG: hypothetical protein JWM62_3251 [Frankiales bacterium]|nr:hypothetical protein [Frankiales bacterium]
MLVAADRDGIICTWSCGATALYGWTAEEAVGRPLAMLAPPDRQAELNARLRLYDGEPLPAFETLRLHRDGTEVPVELHVVPVRDAAGAVVGTAALHRDLRRERTAEVALQASQDELRARFLDSPVPQSRVGMDARVLAVNPSMEKLMGSSSEELVGQDALGFYVEEDRCGLEATLGDLAAGRITYVRQERTLCAADGRLVPIVMTVTLVHDRQGQPLLAASVEDVTAVRAAERRAREQAARYEALLETMPVAVFTYDRNGICTSSRGSALVHFGVVEDELVGVNLRELYLDRPEVVAAYDETLAGRPSRTSLEVGEHVWAGHYRPLRSADGEVEGGIGIAVDVTPQVAAERELAASEARLSSLLRHAHDVALVVDLNGRIVFASASARNRLGYDEAELFWKDAASFNHAEDRSAVRAAWRSVLQEPDAVVRFECRVLHADGTWRWADHVLTNLVGDPAVRGIVVNITESTQRRRAEEELRHLAVRDRLTGLANRTLLLDRAERALAVGRRTGAATGLVLLDVARMAAVNERVGQAGGDEVLSVLASRLLAVLRPTDTVARVGGDAFALLAEDVASEEDLRARASALVEVAADPVLVHGQELQVALQVGTAITPAADAGALLAAAERAALVNRVPSRVVVAAAAVGSRQHEVEALRRAVRDGELVMHYQPVVEVATGRPVAAEALVRWHHPERGLLCPSDFIPLAEASGVIVDLGAWVVREVVRQLVRWQGRALTLGVNLSPRQLAGEDLLVLVRDLLAASGVPGHRLVVEVTESALMDDPGATDVLQALSELGVSLALDDFGTGYSSLTYLKRFPVDSIKIDRSFVAGLGRDADDDAIVASVVSLARAVGKQVVAEGVETAAQLEVLRSLGVDLAQGFLWSPALPPAEFETWLGQSRPTTAPARRALPVQGTPVLPSSGGDDDRILELHREGASLHTIAAALNAEGRRTPAGPRWTPKTVARVVAALVPPV